jgi:hypothetical protein
VVVYSGFLLYKRFRRHSPASGAQESTILRTTLPWALLFLLGLASLALIFEFVGIYVIVLISLAALAGGYASRW